eukprot:TRINITY_DN37024_c0_g1_i1.p1 TRINITY_DN37024_c0_g1~~TRINITY_DN37024_c0_g1_i1.p1  ORF type:complete len:235 (-),score=35.27 TRINITY_DN37024_c0_g1_i1:425-1129(-)
MATTRKQAWVVGDPTCNDLCLVPPLKVAVKEVLQEIRGLLTTGDIAGSIGVLDKLLDTSAVQKPLLDRKHWDLILPGLKRHSQEEQNQEWQNRRKEATNSSVDSKRGSDMCGSLGKILPQPEKQQPLQNRPEEARKSKPGGIASNVASSRCKNSVLDVPPAMEKVEILQNGSRRLPSIGSPARHGAAPRMAQPARQANLTLCEPDAEEVSLPKAKPSIFDAMKLLQPVKDMRSC